MLCRNHLNMAYILNTNLVNWVRPWRAQKYIPIPGTHLDNDYTKRDRKYIPKYTHLKTRDIILFPNSVLDIRSKILRQSQCFSDHKLLTLCLFPVNVQESSYRVSLGKSSHISEHPHKGSEVQNIHRLVWASGTCTEFPSPHDFSTKIIFFSNYDSHLILF